MRAVVTGGAGFIGSHMVDAVLYSGGEVLCIDNFSTGREENIIGAKRQGANFRLEECNICDERAARILLAFKPDIVFHLAAQINVRESVADPVSDTTTNVVGTVNLLEASSKAGVERFVFASTGGAIYGEQNQFPATEEHACCSESPYGVGKRAAEEYLAYYARASGMTTVALRFSNVYGPRQNPKGEAGVVAIFTERLFAGQKLRVNGDGRQTRDFIYVDDVVRANLLAGGGALKRGYHVFNVGTGIETSVLQIIEYLRDPWSKVRSHSKGARRLEYEHGPDLPGEQRRSVIDSSKLSRELDWHVSVSIDEGIRRTIESFREKA